MQACKTFIALATGQVPSQCCDCERLGWCNVSRVALGTWELGTVHHNQLLRQRIGFKPSSVIHIFFLPLRYKLVGTEPGMMKWYYLVFPDSSSSKGVPALTSTLKQCKCKLKLDRQRQTLKLRSGGCAGSKAVSVPRVRSSALSVLPWLVFVQNWPNTQLGCVLANKIIYYETPFVTTFCRTRNFHITISNRIAEISQNCFSNILFYMLHFCVYQNLVSRRILASYFWKFHQNFAKAFIS